MTLQRAVGRDSVLWPTLSAQGESWSLLSHKISIDKNASHGAWVRDLAQAGVPRLFGRLAGWALGTVFGGILGDFVDELFCRERDL